VQHGEEVQNSEEGQFWLRRRTGGFDGLVYGLPRLQQYRRPADRTQRDKYEDELL
jgi:hypothetical protein